MKKIVTLIAAVMMVITMAGCGNVQMVDTTWSFEKAVIYLPNGDIIEGDVQSWVDFENSDMI